MANTVAVIGAGPVGCLTAIQLSRRGLQVHLYESCAEESFFDGSTAQRSINLALSVRGISALRSIPPNEEQMQSGISLADKVLSEVVPMSARMIHTLGKDGSVQLDRQPYGTQGEGINSLDRMRLNRLLLEQALAEENVHSFFEHALINVQRRRHNDTVLLTFDVAGKGIVETAHVMLFGCDGINSMVRCKTTSSLRMNISQSYIDTGYVELRIPAGRPRGGACSWKMDPNCLHIWPKHHYMLIALPNTDGSFTVTLFAPFPLLEACREHEEEVLTFFSTNFPDALRAMNEKELVHQMLTIRASPLGTIQCDPLAGGSSIVLLGDAAHAMVPFYGQGLNCGLEDVRVFMEEYDSAMHGDNAISLLQNVKGSFIYSYAMRRRADVDAIQRLAQENYTVMRSKVLSPFFLLRKRLDFLLATLLSADRWQNL
ncbi:kynurenine 3-monooxygenase [Malassezia vespertilionis]|uniref:kynurenine 3-monooxygenase n=1 Tax=Malassezia vespertilionis TaxID=2020962 RepID=UPI0024B10F26|nr:kynurenine 3-monooxygenase [Malassezia vespertilionis]WFD05497.1 kynurenine 3-monooxygenase [Malassezia vespertilionis]